MAAVAVLYNYSQGNFRVLGWGIGNKGCVELFGRGFRGTCFGGNLNGVAAQVVTGGTTHGVVGGQHHTFPDGFKMLLVHIHNVRHLRLYFLNSFVQVVAFYGFYQMGFHPHTIVA